MPYVESVPSWWFLVLSRHPDAAAAVEARWGPLAAAGYLRTVRKESDGRPVAPLDP